MLVTIKVKNARRMPVIIAPIMLVAANSIPRRITEVNIVPRIPTNSTGIVILLQ